MYRFTYQQWVKGKCVKTHYVYVDTKEEAISLLSKKYKGVFKYVSKD